MGITCDNRSHIEPDTYLGEDAPEEEKVLEVVLDDGGRVRIRVESVVLVCGEEESARRIESRSDHLGEEFPREASTVHTHLLNVRGVHEFHLEAGAQRWSCN